jgi:ATP-dependent DNA helicase RecQ
VLRYFGDPAARPRCDNCDNCLGIKHAPRTGPANAGRKPRGRAGAKAGPTDAPLSHEEGERLEALKRLRSRLAKDEEVPAYVIFPDRAVREIARVQPQSLAQLAQVHGVGPARLEKFGREVLEALRDG